MISISYIIMQPLSFGRCVIFVLLFAPCLPVLLLHAIVFFLLQACMLDIEKQIPDSLNYDMHSPLYAI